MKWWNWMPWSSFYECWVSSQLFQLSSFTSSRGSLVPLYSTITMISSAYLRLLIFLLAILIPACDSSSLAFRMMYSAYKLNKQDDNIKPCHSPFPIFNQSVVLCLVLIIASWQWRPLKVPWTARRSNQSILKEISPEYLLEGLILKLKLQYFGHRMWRTDSLDKTLMLGKIEGRRRRRW